jgi:hypothetical protein
MIVVWIANQPTNLSWQQIPDGQGRTFALGWLGDDIVTMALLIVHCVT